MLYDFMYRAVHAMHTITYTEERSRLSETMTQVCEDHHPIIITKKSDMAVVMMSLSDYEALEETSYLLRSPKNAQRILNSIRELESGSGIEKDLIEE